MNQHGLAPLALLFIVVLGIFIMWELNESITYLSRMDAANQTANQSPSPSAAPICLTGITSDCNDSNDVFLLP